jgi:hypothetical protein
MKLGAKCLVVPKFQAALEIWLVGVLSYPPIYRELDPRSIVRGKYISQLKQRFGLAQVVLKLRSTTWRVGALEANIFVVPFNFSFTLYAG